MPDKKTNEHLTDFGYQTIPEEEKESHVKEVFDEVAPKYDIMNDVLSFGMHRLWKKYTVDKAAVKTGMNVLDIAGGTGDISIAMAE
ncbi:MAG: class I SAM-dependent methyltransferase, partial [Turicimonas muris]